MRYPPLKQNYTEQFLRSPLGKNVEETRRIIKSENYLDTCRPIPEEERKDWTHPWFYVSCSIDIKLNTLTGSAFVYCLGKYVRKWLGAMLAVKRLAGVAPEVNLRECTLDLHLPPQKQKGQKPLWLWNPEEMPPQIQNRGTSGSKIGNTCVYAQIFKKKTKKTQKKLLTCILLK